MSRWRPTNPSSCPASQGWRQPLHLVTMQKHSCCNAQPRQPHALQCTCPSSAPPSPPALQSPPPCPIFLPGIPGLTTIPASGHIADSLMLRRTATPASRFAAYLPFLSASAASRACSQASSTTSLGSLFAWLPFWCAQETDRDDRDSQHMNGPIKRCTDGRLDRWAVSQPACQPEGREGGRLGGWEVARMGGCEDGRLEG